MSSGPIYNKPNEPLNELEKDSIHILKNKSLKKYTFSSLSPGSKDELQTIFDNVPPRQHRVEKERFRRTQPGA